MVGWHHRLNGHEFEQAPGGGEGQGTLVVQSRGAAKSQTRLTQSDPRLELWGAGGQFTWDALPAARQGPVSPSGVLASFGVRPIVCRRQTEGRL